jgi:hypothetical protein
MPERIFNGRRTGGRRVGGALIPAEKSLAGLDGRSCNERRVGGALIVAEKIIAEPPVVFAEVVCPVRTGAGRPVVFADVVSPVRPGAEFLCVIHCCSGALASIMSCFIPMYL